MSTQVYEIAPRRQTRDAMEFGSRAGMVAGLMALAPGGLLFYGLQSDSFDETGYKILGAFTAFLLIAAVQRFHLSFDLRNGEYKLRYGFFGLRSRTGRTTDLDALILKRDWRKVGSKGNRRQETWIHLVEIPGMAMPIALDRVYEEKEGFKRAKGYADTLKLAWIDRTGDVEARHEAGDSSSWQAALPVGEMSPDPGPLSAHSSLVLSGRPGQRIVLLPSLNTAIQAVVMVVVGLSVIALGLWGAFFFAEEFLPNADPEHRLSSSLLFGSPFILVGLYFCLNAIFNAAARRRVREDRDHLIIDKEIFGLGIPGRRFPKAEVRELKETRHGVKGSQIMLRTQRHNFYLGRHLDPSARDWLLRFLRHVTSSPS